MRMRNLIFIGTMCIVASSCQPNKAKIEADRKTGEFFIALKKGDKMALSRLYPSFRKFDEYYKSDSGKIISTTEANKVITVSVDNRFTNTLGKTSQETICLYYRVDSLGQPVLYDSKGLSDFDTNDNYIFATKTGCIDTRTDTTDQQILRLLKRSRSVFVDKAVWLYWELKKDVRVVTWNWDAGYGGSASGQGIVRNGSNYSIPSLKYKVTFKDQWDNPLTFDEGYVSYDALAVGESKSFSFFTSYVGGASRASIELLFDDDMIFKYLATRDWSGDEYEQYYKDHVDTVRDN